MNILFFLTPKSDVVYIYADDTLKQALEKMKCHRYSALPILTKSGHYLGTITEGDLLWYISKMKKNFDLKMADIIPIIDVPRLKDNTPVFAQCDMEDLMSKALNQNFVPVIDDKEIFIGIITRRDIIQYLYKKLEKCGEVLV